MSDLLPLFPLGTVVFPGMPIPLHIFEDRYRRMLTDRAESDPIFGAVLIRSGVDTDEARHLSPIGTATRLISQRRRGGGRSDIVVQGTQRFEILDVRWDLGYGLATVEWREEHVGDVLAVRATMQEANDLFHRYVRGVTKLTGREFEGVQMSDDPIEASYDLASRLPLHTWERQPLLEEDSAERRFVRLLQIVRREVALLERAGAAGLAINHPGSLVNLN